MLIMWVRMGGAREFGEFDLGKGGVSVVIGGFGFGFEVRQG